MKFTTKLRPFIWLEGILFVVAAILFIYGVSCLFYEKEFVVQDNAFVYSLIALVSTSVLQLILAVFAFIQKKGTKGILLLIYIPLKLFLLYSLWVCYIIFRGGFPSGI